MCTCRVPREEPDRAVAIWPNAVALLSPQIAITLAADVKVSGQKLLEAGPSCLLYVEEDDHIVLLDVEPLNGTSREVLRLEGIYSPVLIWPLEYGVE